MITYIKPWIYPIILSVEMVLACMITYFKSTHDGHVEKDFPYISDTGNKGIAASVFSLLFSIYGFLAFINMTIRFEQVKAHYTYDDNKALYIANIVTILVGMLSFLGILLAGNFQIDTLELVHNIGALGAFGFGALYLGMQSILSFLWRKLPGSHIVINIIRVVMSILQLAFILGTFIVTLMFRKTNDRSLKREAAIQEWILGFLVTFYFLTFIPEFYQYDWRIQFERTHKRNKIDAKDNDVTNSNMIEKNNDKDAASNSKIAVSL